MTDRWLNIIGIGEDGLDGLSNAAKTLVADAQIIIGGDRHHTLAGNSNATRVAWPSPFNAMIDELTKHRGKKIVILVTGDPLWYSVGARILKSIPAEEIAFHPQLSAFQWAAARMGWSLADTETLTIHGRPAEQAIPYFANGARLLILTKDGSSPKRVAEMLTECGYGDSQICVLAALGGEQEQRFDGIANSWNQTVPDFHVLAVDCQAASDACLLPRGPGLPDSAFVHDGKVTKQEVRAITVAKLAPARGAMLWDIGLGCGSVAIEWMRAGRDARAIGLEPQEKRRLLAAQNALALGAPALKIVDATAPHGLVELPEPDAVFIGGGLSVETFEACFGALKPRGRLVANAVTLESEAILIELHGRFGGELSRIAVSRVESVGPFRGWKPLMPVTQLSITKRNAH